MHDNKQLSQDQQKRRQAFLSEISFAKYNIFDNKLLAKSGIGVSNARVVALTSLLLSFAIPSLILYFTHSLFSIGIGFYISILLFVAMSFFIRYQVAKNMVIYFKNKSPR